MYWMLFIWEGEYGWRPQWGAYNLADVKQEVRDSYRQYPRKHRRIEAMTDESTTGIERRAKELTALAKPN